jgi:hypothetical protein
MIYAVYRFFSVAIIGSLLPFLLCCLHQFPLCLEPMTLVITVPPTARKPDVVRALLNLPAHGRIRDVTVVFIGIGICFHLAPCFLHFVQTADFHAILHQEPPDG